MLKMEEWLLIRDLYSQGLNISEISERTGYDRKTVRKYLHLKTLPEPQKRSPRPSKLDPYKPYSLEKINENHYTATRLFREIQKMDFDGGETIVKDFVRKAPGIISPQILSVIIALLRISRWFYTLYLLRNR